MAKVERVKGKPGQMFGGKGVAVFRPFQRTPSATDVLTPEERLAAKVESAIMRVTMAIPPPDTENPEKTP